MVELWKIDLNECRKTCGIDAYIYLMFLKHSTIYFGGVSIVSCLLLTLYKVGDTNEDKLDF